MLVFWKERLVFLAVPKTGTQAFAAALGPRASMAVNDPPELKHSPIYRYNRFFRPMFEKMGAEMETMAVVREPVDWLGSWYRYRQRPFLRDKPTSTADISFDEFVNAYLTGDRPPFANVGSQSKFLEPRPNGLRCNHVFAYEAQDVVLAFLEEKLDTKITLPIRNASPKVLLDLEPKTEAKLRRKCAEEFELWDGARRG